MLKQWLAIKKEGIYCIPGDFYIDPIYPVPTAIITHAHGDHARSGHQKVLAHSYTIDIMEIRYGKDCAINLQRLDYYERIQVKNVEFYLLPAGHILGSAQIVIEYQGLRLIISGDYKRALDPTCTPFVVEPCDIFITEATFGLPIFKHPPIETEVNKLLTSLHTFPNRCHLIGVYALAIMANTFDFPTFNRALIKELTINITDPFLFELSYDFVGDISETIALLWPEPALYTELPLLSDILVTFKSLAKSEIKPYLMRLLNGSNSSERWAILKLGTRSLRIGISERFLKNALAKYGDVNVQEIEKIWHGIQPPYIELFTWLEKKGAIPLNEKSIFFHPVMLSHVLDEKDVQQINAEQFAFERKYDGIRVQIVSHNQEKALFTRTGENISSSFLDLLLSIKGNVVLDGELIINTSNGVGSFNDLQKRLNRKSLSNKLLSEAPAGIILYDILIWDEIDLRALSFIERRQKLEKWFSLNRADNILLSELLTFRDEHTLFQLKQQILDENHPAVEGLMIKHKLSPYLSGRPKGHWYKWKQDPLLIDAVLMYAQRGHGKRSSYFSDYTFGLWKDGQLLPIGKAYFGFTDEELKQLDHWVRNNTIQRFGPVQEVKKSLVFEIAFDAANLSLRHKSGVALRFPRINRIRWDKPAEEADQLDSLIKLIK